MAPIAWKPQYSVGDPAVDHEHRELVDLVNTAAAAILDGRPDADIERCLGDLMRAITAHFAHEETQMKRAGYAQYQPHKDDHERLLDSLRDIMDSDPADRNVTAERLTEVLEAWFIDHFRTHDARLHRQLGPHDH
ncbi:bacteriohemerythrin [Defluviimonas sp. SAOS-178_SWC]|uniref:bacteriohemerythrin n=1 Tax=Defluviimonas sp. SAOS-178_SWC TaxID=3121287 RepID=UPI003221FDEF